MTATSYNLADLFEQAADEWPDRLHVSDERASRTFAEMDARANRLAHHLTSVGIGHGDYVGIYATNRVEWVEAVWAVFKVRAVWININYRYVEDELAYLFNEAGLTYLVVEDTYVDRAAAVAPDLPRLVIGEDYEEALAAQSDARDFAPRSNDDHYVLFTGGTTGMPKGVIWRHEDVCFALGGGIDVRTGELMQDPSEFIDKGNNGFQIVCYPLSPLMHGASQWALMGQCFSGNSIVLRSAFDPIGVWEAVASDGVNLLFLTGDAMARPLLDSLDDERVKELDLSSLFAISSSAVLFSQTCKDEFLERFPNLVISDSIGSSESGANGVTFVSKGTPMQGGPNVKAVHGATVLDDDLNPVEPGSGVIGRLARSGHIPQGYLNDPVKTAALFVTGGDGTRYVIPGDAATIEADGTITMLGRGSVSINTGGEKVFPEEVENSLKSNPDVLDAVVVGVPDDRWGEHVAAVVQPREGRSIDLAGVQEHCRQHVAGYKVPRQLVIVDEVVRSPAGKHDYRWAKRVATEADQSESAS